MVTASDVVRIVQKLVAPMHRRVRGMVARAVVQLVDDSTVAQIVQLAVRADELRDDVERFGQFGFTSNPPVNSDAIVLFVGGNTDHGIMIGVEDRATRPTGLLSGESAMYTAANGLRVYCKADGKVLLGTSPTDFVALATNTENRLAALEQFALTHVHTCAAPASPGTPAVPAPVLNTPPAPVAATEVKAK